MVPRPTSRVASDKRKWASDTAEIKLAKSPHYIPEGSEAVWTGEEADLECRAGERGQFDGSGRWRFETSDPRHEYRVRADPGKHDISGSVRPPKVLAFTPACARTLGPT